MWRERATYEPRISADERESLIARWHQAVERSRGWAGLPAARRLPSMPRPHLLHRLPGLHRPPARRRPARARPGRLGSSPWSSAGWRDAAAEAAAAIDADRIEVVAGDIAERHLGLGDDDYERLPAEVGVVHHLAAIYDLAVPEEIAQKVNVEGTGNVLDFCRDADDLERLNYVSTAYVAGRPDRRRLRARAQPRPGLQEPLRVDQVPGRGLGPRADRPDPDDDLPAGDRGRRLAHRGDAEVRRALLRAALHRRQPRAAGCRSPTSAAARTPFNVVPVDFIVDVDDRARPSSRTRSARRSTSATPIRSRRPRCSPLLTELYADRKPAYRVPPRGVAAALRFAAGPRALRRHALAVDPLPQPPGPLRHPARDRAARRERPALPALPRVRAGDGRLLPRATRTTRRSRPLHRRR